MMLRDFKKHKYQLQRKNEKPFTEYSLLCAKRDYNFKIERTSIGLDVIEVSGDNKEIEKFAKRFNLEFITVLDFFDNVWEHNS